MTSTSQLTSLPVDDLSRTTGGGEVRGPLSGDVNQQINTNWGGTQIINEAPKSPTTVLEYRKQHPELRIGSPRPIRR